VSPVEQAYLPADDNPGVGGQPPGDAKDDEADADAGYDPEVGPRVGESRGGI